ncbi:MAG: P-type conjugative transfer protein TrbJ [Sulfuricurvum sp.]
MKKRSLALLASMCLLSSSASATGIPTVDVAAILQSTMQYMQMLEDYAMQVQQYERMYEQLKQQIQMVEDSAKNLNKLDSFGFKDIKGVLKDTHNIMSRVGAISYDLGGASGQFESIFKDSSEYSQMLGSASNEEQRNTLYSNRYNQLTQTNQNTLNGTLQKLEAKYNQLDSESEDLNDLRSRAANAEGNLEVLQALSDLVAFNTDELRKLRYTIMDQSNAMLTAMAAQNNEKILGKASLDKFSNKTNRTNIYDTKGDARDFAKVK